MWWTSSPSIGMTMMLLPSETKSVYTHHREQPSNMSNTSVTVPEILSHYSPMGYSPGDIVPTGTVSGVAGWAATPPSLYLKPGDVVEAEIERVGTLRNPVISWSERYGEPAASAAQA